MTSTPPSTQQPPPAERARVVCFGELLLRLSAPGRELLLQTATLDAHFGGAEANVAASLAILGHDSAMVSTLPDNALGRACIGELRRHGVDVRGVCAGVGRMGLYFLTTGALQRPSEVLYDRAGSAFANARADAYDWPTLLHRAQWLHVSGITPALGEAAAEATLRAVRQARALGVRVAFDCNYRSSLWGTRTAQAPAVLSALAAEADVVFGNDRDIALMLGRRFAQGDEVERFRAAADAAFAAWPRLRWLAAAQRTLDNADHHALLGCLATREALLTTPSHVLAGIVDRIGGGDAFAAGLLHGLLRGMDDADALAFAVAAICLKHAVIGDVNLLREADMLAFVGQQGMDVRR